VVTPSPNAGIEPVSGSSIELRWSRRDDRAEIEVIGPRIDDDHPALVDAALQSVHRLMRRPDWADAEVVLAAAHPAEDWNLLPEAVAEELGLAPRRLLLQLRRGLPIPAHHPLRSRPALPIRAFRDGIDDDAWLRVNNRAFAEHPDQGRETATTLAARRSEDWYDPAGFLVADDPTRPGELAGFCWTKVHPASLDDPALGEIYVIGVDPSHRGEGLGPGFVLAGLDHLARANGGVEVANLYVEADNAPALRLYDRLGFRVHERRRVYAR
jgi:mycothiol synthase